MSVVRDVSPCANPSGLLDRAVIGVGEHYVEVECTRQQLKRMCKSSLCYMWLVFVSKGTMSYLTRPIDVVEPNGENVVSYDPDTECCSTLSLEQGLLRLAFVRLVVDLVARVDS